MGGEITKFRRLRRSLKGRFQINANARHRIRTSGTRETPFATDVSFEILPITSSFSATNHTLIALQIAYIAFASSIFLSTGDNPRLGKVFRQKPGELILSFPVTFQHWLLGFPHLRMTHYQP